VVGGCPKRCMQVRTVKCLRFQMSEIGVCWTERLRRAYVGSNGRERCMWLQMTDAYVGLDNGERCCDNPNFLVINYI
jgi:hypothetical protein